MLLAQKVGLLPDVARFEQYSQFGTFRDLLSLDHGDLGAEFLTELEILDSIYLTCKGIGNGSDHHNFSGLEQNSQITPEILQQLTQKKVVNYNLMKTGVDFQLLKIGRVYDLNYTPSMALLCKRNHLEELKATLPEINELEPVLAEIDAHLREQLQ